MTKPSFLQKNITYLLSKLSKLSFMSFWGHERLLFKKSSESLNQVTLWQNSPKKLISHEFKNNRSHVNFQNELYILGTSKIKCGLSSILECVQATYFKKTPFFWAWQLKRIISWKINNLYLFMSISILISLLNTIEMITARQFHVIEMNLMDLARRTWAWLR